MTARKSTTKKSDKIDYADITEAEVQSVWPDLCMADRYQIAHAKMLQNIAAWQAEAIADPNNNRHQAEFIKQVIELAESDNFHIN